ncbi:WD domain-containing protein [Phyllosticta citrichinensis]|uniref:WD domain-containing protein n=1 Tax=Phyllosticta citrichinensis TaxID=1130410 RepID=A0ABR1XMJ7_9PEZI
MSRSADPGHFFQTSTALSESARKAQKAKNEFGAPIKLPSKLLAIAADPLDDDEGVVYVAEAAGCVKRVVLETGEVTHRFDGPAAPLTSLALLPKARLVAAGCWDKSVWLWPLPSSAPSTTTISASATATASTNTPAPKKKPTTVASSGRLAGAHTDFVKTLLACSLGGLDVLVSGGSDAAIVVWDVAQRAPLYKLTGHARGVLALALDPAAYTTRLSKQAPAVTVLSAGSDREIRAWRLERGRGREVPVRGGATAADDEEADGGESAAAPQDVEPLVRHETSVDALYFDADDDLWTASADRSAKCLSRARDWEPDTSLAHPDFVRDVVVDEAGGWVVTACRDEEVRVWDRGSGKLHHTFAGHYEEVTGLLLLPGQRLVSVSIDGTIRQWSLKARDLKGAIEEAERLKQGESKEIEDEKKEIELDDDEERELAELMEDDD